MGRRIFCARRRHSFDPEIPTIPSSWFLLPPLYENLHRTWVIRSSAPAVNIQLVEGSCLWSSIRSHGPEKLGPELDFNPGSELQPEPDDAIALATITVT